MTDEERIEHKRELARKRARKYYEQHKAEVSQIRKDKYHAIVESIPDQVQSTLQPPTSNDMLLERLQSMDLKVNTKRTYMSSFHRLVALLDGELIPYFKKKARQMVGIINESDFSTSTKRLLIQVALFMITNMHIVVNKPSLSVMKSYFESLKVQSNDELHEKMLTDEVPTWKEYLDKCKDMFGVESQEYVLASLYQELTLRDDYQLKLVNKMPKTIDTNLLVLTKTTCTIVVASYKTDSAYGIIKQKLTKRMGDMLRKFISNNEIQEGNYIFGDRKLSPLIAATNKQLGYEGSGGVNFYRHISVTESLSKEPSSEERVKLAEKMKHSVFTQLKYIRKLI
jgi:hypothetical protein